jgi:indolepyruvate decarboxylase
VGTTIQLKEKQSTVQPLTDTPKGNGTTGTFTIGGYLAARLEQIGLKHHFAVAGDYNLVLLDQLLLNKNIQQVYCCNELNCAFSAEGYARAKGAAACVVTYSVGALSAFDGIGGAYAEDLPVILISGSPNTNDLGSNHLLHHTLGTHNFRYQLEMARHITCEAVAITHPEEAPHLIDKAIRAALRDKKPVYIETPCNLAAAPCSAPGPFTSLLEKPQSDPQTLAAAVDAAARFLGKAVRPVLLAGPKLRAHGGIGAFRDVAEAIGCGVAVMPSAKSFFPEEHEQFLGIYLGSVSSPGCGEIVDSADAVLAAAPLFNDYTTVGWTARPSESKLIQVDPDRVRVAGTTFDGVYLAEFLAALARVAKKNPTTLIEFRRTRVEAAQEPAAAPEASLTRREMCRQIRELIDPNTTLLVETGDSWFNGFKTKLPDGARFEIEMQWGHIGWSVPAAFGYALGAPERRIVLMVGDGSFQLTGQEVCQMIRLKLPVIIFLINNRGYTIEVEIHDGPYNNIKNWDYAGIVNVFNATDGEGRGLRATNGGELAAAIKQAAAHKGGPTLIECTIDRDDCTKELMEWGTRVAAANSRPQLVG